MPIVDVPDTCKGCGACCTGLNVTTEGGNVPVIMAEGTGALRSMRQRSDGTCVALNPETCTCAIYLDRPEVCRTFNDGSAQCLESLNRRQQNVMPGEARKVEEVLKAAVDFGLSRGWAPEVHFGSVIKPGYAVYLRRLTQAPETQPAKLQASLVEACRRFMKIAGRGGHPGDAEKHGPFSIVWVSDDPPEATYLCPCGAVFDVDATDEENLRRSRTGSLMPVCPKCKTTVGR